MSAGAAATAASASSADNVSLAGRLGGVLRHPRETFRAVAAAPRPWAPLVLLFVGPFAAMAALLATDVGQLALVDQWERTAVAFGQSVGDARYAELQALSRRGVLYAALVAFVNGPLAAAVLAGILVAAFGRRASYAQVLGVTAYAGIILVLRDIVAAPLNYARESMGSPTTLGMVLRADGEGSPVGRLLWTIDLFVLWWLVVLATGLAVLYQRRTRDIAARLIGAYAALALLLAGLMAVLGDS